MGAIDNLGAYGQFTRAAKAAGGIEPMIRGLEKAAVSRSAPGIFIQGSLFGLGIGAAAVVGAFWLFDSRRKNSQPPSPNETHNQTSQSTEEGSSQKKKEKTRDEAETTASPIAFSEGDALCVDEL